MSAYERVASALIGTPWQRPAESLRWLDRQWQRWKHPELRDLIDEDQHIRELLQRVLKPDSNCIDVGCHLGYMLNQMVRLAPRGHHIAVEPIPYKAGWLRRKFPQVDVRQIAVSDKAGQAEFFVSAGHSGLSGLQRNPAAGAVSKISVALMPLDDVASKDHPVNFLKVDVEGFEFSAFRGARRILSEDRPLVLFECTQVGLTNVGGSAAQIFSFLNDEVRYDIFLIKDWLSAGQPLNAASFAGAMIYPFKAFNFVAAPRK